MPAKPWQTLASSDPNANYVALISYLPLKSLWKVLPFLVYTARITKQLERAEGLLGYSLLAHFSKRFWTLSAWRNEEALQNFVHKAPHLQIMSALAYHMAGTKFVRWPVKGSELPLRWEEGLARLGDHSHKQV